MSWGKKFPEREIDQAIISIQTPQQWGEAIRAARKQLALTQPKLALAAGGGVRFVVELEAGQPTMRLAQVLRVLHACQRLASDVLAETS